MKIPNIPSAADIQAAIDDQITARGLGQYVEWVRYLPQDATVPEDATHVLSLASLGGADRVEVAIKAKGFYGALANIALKAL